MSNTKKNGCTISHNDKNITLTKADGAGTYTFFCANGYPLVIGEGVTCKANASGSYMSLMGGVMPTTLDGDGDLVSSSLSGSTADTDASFTGNTDLTVKSGTWRNIYAGPYKGTMTGDAKLSMSGGKVTYKAGAVFAGTLKGNAVLNITGGEIAGDLYGGGCNSSGKVTGNVSIALKNAAISNAGELAGDLSAGAGVSVGTSVGVGLGVNVALASRSYCCAYSSVRRVRR